ncbi:MAG: nucleoside 2-deoxyribosyltransferase domain-containing protein [Ginsengibacter sp.]
MKKVFLGGTCNGSRWRDDLIKLLTIGYYQPQSGEWTAEMMQEEKRQREICDFCLYVITPKMTGFYSVAEVVDDSNKRPSKTIFSFLKEDEGQFFSQHQLKSLEQTAEMVRKNGARFLSTFEEIAGYLNNH